MKIDCISDLLPCPFCKGMNLRIPKQFIMINDFEDCLVHESCVQCIDCGASGPTSAHIGSENIRKEWNKR